MTSRKDRPQGPSLGGRPSDAYGWRYSREGLAPRGTKVVTRRDCCQRCAMSLCQRSIGNPIPTTASMVMMTMRMMTASMATTRALSHPHSKKCFIR